MSVSLPGSGDRWGTEVNLPEIYLLNGELIAEPSIRILATVDFRPF
jgi:hypothetical protein